MKPGIRVTSPRSIILALAGTVTLPAVPTAVIVLSVTTITALFIDAAPVPSISRAAFNTTTPLPTGGSGVIRVDEVCAVTERHSAWTRHNARQTGLKFLKVAPLTNCCSTSAGNCDVGAKRGIHVREKALRGNRVEPVVDVGRTTNCIARDRDRGDQLLAIQRHEVRSARIAKTRSAISGRLVLRQTDIAAIERVETGERKHARDRIHVLEERHTATDDAVLQSITGVGKHRGLKSVLGGELVQQTTSRQRCRCHSTNTVIQNQHTDISGIALALVVIRICHHMRDRQQLRLGAGEFAERDRLVETDISNESFKGEVTGEKIRTMTCGKKNVISDHGARADRKDLTGRRRFNDECAGIAEGIV